MTEHRSILEYLSSVQQGSGQVNRCFSSPWVEVVEQWQQQQQRVYLVDHTRRKLHQRYTAVEHLRKPSELEPRRMD